MISINQQISHLYPLWIGNYFNFYAESLPSLNATLPETSLGKKIMVFVAAVLVILASMGLGLVSNLTRRLKEFNVRKVLEPA